MAIADYKISTADVNNVHVEAQPTILRGSAQQNKQVFDAYSDMIVGHFNGLCDYLEMDTSVTIDRNVLLLYASLGWTQD